VEGVTSLQTPICGAVLLVNAMIAEANGQPVKLWIVTRGAQPAGDARSPLSPIASAAWGLTWSAALENPELQAVCVDLDSAWDPDEITKLVAELDEDGREDKVALRGGQRLVARLRRRDRDAGSNASAPQEPYRLEKTGQGTVDGFIVVPTERRAPGPGEIEIRVEATGLNFRDVLNVLNLYPGDAGPLGAECAGVVARVGPGVNDIREGDQVMTMASGCFASHVIAKQELVERTPPGITTVEAAGLPVPYLTAAYALEEIARVKNSDRVLIHAGAGGVGLAAVHIALRAGAEIFATAGSDFKRSYLRTLGVRHVLDSRDDAFDKDILRLTEGRGVDVVLNSLSGSFIDASFRATASRGRFIEIGKRGIWTHERVEALGREIDYQIVDLGEVSEREPERLGKIFSRIASEMAKGTLPLLPLTHFLLEEAPAAFRHMMKARQIGKIVISHKHMAPPPLVRADGEYLVTGGLSGLGLQAAEWLVARGAKYISLIGRRGANSPDTSAAVRRLAAAGAQAHVASVDVGDVDALGAFLAERRSTGRPLRGIIHAAGIIDDAAFVSQDWPRFERVLTAKVGGAQNLDRLTREDSLDWFVMFSSIATMLGSRGQANYSAANTVLDVIAQERRRLGRWTLSIAWGPWAQVGMAAGAPMKERLAASGLSPFTPEEALGAMEATIGTDAANVGIVAANWPQFLRRRDQDTCPPPYFTKVMGSKVRAETYGAEARSTVLLEEMVRAAAPGRRPVIVRNFVRQTACKVLGLTEADGPADSVPLAEVGLDSLLAVELRNVLAKSLRMNLSATLLFDYPSIEELGEFLLNQMRETDEPAKKQPATDKPKAGVEGSTVLAEIAELSDAEVELLLHSGRR
jgi:NADPH:quinone reductase-like Zn-dependent oxidoreductase